jgi:SAM-dependent methyltransferase
MESEDRGDVSRSNVGFWQGEELELSKRFLYRPEFVPLLLHYLGVNDGDAILDVGSGTGFFARQLARALPDARVHALEPDDALRSLAVEGVQRDRLDGRVTLLDGDAYALPFEDDRFDHVTSHTLMCILPDVPRGLREQIRVTRRGGIVSAVVCFCHTAGLPHYHGRYPLPGDHRVDELLHRVERIFAATIRPRLIHVDHAILNQDLVWQFRAVGLEDVRVDGHLMLVSPGDDRVDTDEGAAYAVGMHRRSLRWLEGWRRDHAAELADAGFSEAEFDELLTLKRARLAYLLEDAERVREVMEVVTDPLLIVRGRKP